MADSLLAKLDQLEILYTEQDYTIQTLNQMVTQQDREISQLNLSIEQIKDQLQALKSDLAGEVNSAPEIPPHY